ncbi:unnamed protein product, partial [Brenthis ino]
MTSTPSTQGQRYQGYPYVNPIVIDAPSIDAETASRWTNLPRRQLVPGKKTTNNNVVYVDIPESASSGNNSSVIEGPSRLNPNIKPEPDETPEIYIDLPDTGSQSTEDNAIRREEGGREENATDFVEETIFYDPFKNRRINIPQNDQSTLAGSSNGNAGSSLESSSQNFMSKESYIYGSERLPVLNSTPEREFPEPPPAYTEVAPISPIPVSPEPPRTEVIVPNPQLPTVLSNTDRKLVMCPDCQQRVHTLTVRESGIMTHILAALYLFFNHEKSVSPVLQKQHVHVLCLGTGVKHRQLPNSGLLLMLTKQKDLITKLGSSRDSNPGPPDVQPYMLASKITDVLYVCT